MATIATQQQNMATTATQQQDMATTATQQQNMATIATQQQTNIPISRLRSLPLPLSAGASIHRSANDRTNIGVVPAVTCHWRPSRTKGGGSVAPCPHKIDDSPP